MNKRNILIAQWESNISGSPESAKFLIEALKEKNWNIHVVVGHDGDYVNIYKDLGCEVTIINQKHWLNRKSIAWHLKSFNIRLKSFIYFNKLLKNFSPSIVYINTIVGPEVALAAKYRHIPVIWHIRDMYDDLGGDMHIPRVVGKSGIARFINLFSNKIITVSKAVKTNVFNDYPPEINVVFNGVNDNFRQLKIKKCSKEIIIGIPGTLRPMKGHKFFLKSISTIVSQLPTLKILITGTGSPIYKRELIDIINSSNLNGKVFFIGNVRKMNNFLNFCSLIVIPSSCDPLPRTVMESMAAGCPIITTNVGGIPEMVEHGVNGYLVEYGDNQMLNHFICKLINNPHIGLSMGMSASKKAKTHFTTRHYQNKLMKFIENTCT